MQEHPTYRIDQSDYDPFFKKLRKGKKLKSLKLLNPAHHLITGWKVGTGIPKAGLQMVKGNRKLPKGNPSAIYQKQKANGKLAQLKKKQSLRKREEEKQEKIDRELEQKLKEDEITQQAEQLVLDSQQSNAKKMLLFGVAGLAGLGLLFAGFAYLKSRQDQLKAFGLDQLPTDV